MHAPFKLRDLPSLPVIWWSESRLYFGPFLRAVWHGVVFSSETLFRGDPFFSLLSFVVVVTEPQRWKLRGLKIHTVGCSNSASDKWKFPVECRGFSGFSRCGRRSTARDPKMGFGSFSFCRLSRSTRTRSDRYCSSWATGSLNRGDICLCECEDGVLAHSCDSFSITCDYTIGLSFTYIWLNKIVDLSWL